jgi:predicted amidophosphoribosyltransferase
MESARLTGGIPAEGLLCHPCRAVPPMFERAVAYAVYQDELREMIHLLKYERMGSVAKLLGGFLADSILTLQAEAARELAVVPVPLFRGKQHERGYNQAELLADAAIAELQQRAPEWKLRRANLLTRRRDTRSQFELNPTSRRRNLEGAFAGRSGAVSAGMRRAAGGRYLHHWRDRSRVCACAAAGRCAQSLGRNPGSRTDSARCVVG